MITTIRIGNIKVSSILGVYPEEKKSTREYYLDIEFDYDASEAISVDNFNYAVDYDSLVGRIREKLSGERIELIETAANMALEELTSIEAIIWGKVKVKKPMALKDTDPVEAEIEFVRTDD